MARPNLWINCEECGKKTKAIRQYKSGFYCWNCYIKKLNRMGVGKKKIKDLVVVQRSASFVLSLKDDKLLNKRLSEIFTSPKGIGSYVKALILNDLGNWKKEDKK